MTLLGSVDIPFTKSTKIAVDATDTAGQAATVAQQATDTAGQAKSTAEAANQTATQAEATAKDAAQAAQIAIATANGKNKAYYGSVTPINPKSGDIWFVEDDSNNVIAIKHYDGTQWVTDVDNTALEQQISAAQEAAGKAVTVGQTAQQVAQQAVQIGDSAAKTAEEAKQAANAAQTDAADAVTQANNAVDTANTAKQVASDAATQASIAKTNAQTAMSNAQEAINRADAANANANTREKSIIKSNAAPSNPATDQLWIDTSKTPQIMRRWNGTTWVDLSPTQASQIGAVSTTTYTTDITNINNTLSQKVNVTTVNTLTGRVDKAETAISQNASDIALKADKTVVDTLKNTVDNHGTLISQNADEIKLKASQSTVDTLTGRISTAEATLKTQANEIAARITKTDADAKYATQTALTATANSLTSNISAVQTNLNNLQVGVRNLALQTGNPFTMSSFSNINNQTAIVYNINQNELNGHVYISCDVTVSGIVGDSTTGTPGIRLQFYTCDNNNTSRWDAVSDIPLTNGTYKISVPLTANYVAGYKQAYVQLRADYIRRGTVTVKNLMVTIGNRYVGWSPAPEDMATQSQISQLVDDINLRVQKGDVINQINVSTEGILIDGKKVHITGQTTIDNAVIKDAMIQSMTANKLTAGTIDANVVTVKNINASNIVTGTLDASKATVANIDASKITTGTLSAARIAAGSIDASKINVSSLSALSANLGNVTAGNISGVNINIGNGNFSVDTAGNLVAKNANITGTINATSGSFSGSVNVISTVTNPWGNYDTVKINPTYRFPIHIDDDESRHTYLSSGIVEIYYPAFSDTNTTSAKTTIEPSLITFSENDKTVSQITANAIYSIDYYNGQSTIISNGNAQFGNIAFNGYHSIISNDGGQLYFTDSGGNRIDITVSQVNADKWIMPNNMKIGYHTIQTNDNGDLWFTGANGNLIPIHIKSWTSSSKYDLKENFETISPEEALQKILRTDVVSWNFKGETEKHIGPIIGGGYSMDTSFIAENGEEKKSDDIVGALMLSTKALVNYHQELVLKIADLEARLAKLEA